jgi:hypothetical protein
VHCVIRRSAIYRFDADQWRALAAAGRISGFTYYFVAGAEPVSLNELVTDEHIVLTCEIPGFALTQEGCAVADDLEDT